MHSTHPQSLGELANEISLLIEYGAPSGEFAFLKEVMEKYNGDQISLNLFHHFYSYLPEAKDDGIVKITRVANRQGAFLLCTTTLFSEYLYLVTHERAALIGRLENGLTDRELLDIFGWQSDDDFRKDVIDLEDLPEHSPINESHDLCPICGTSDGELHAFGCPVEVCPWCEGQLTNCECRFTRTGRNDFTSESHVQELLDLLEEEGRIPFDSSEQRPSFMSEE